MTRRMSRPGRALVIPVVVLALAALALVPPAPLAAQSAPRPADDGAPWVLYDAVGYGGLGFGLGLAAAWGMENDSGFGPPGEALVVLGVGTVAGIVTGAILGSRAGHAVAEGRPLGTGHRAATLAGPVLAGGTLGALAAIPLINGEGEGTALGSDERTVGLLTLAGFAVGSVVAWRLSDELPVRGVQAGPAGDGGYRLRVQMEL